MRKLFLIICALCFTQVAFAALDRDYFDYTDSAEFQAIPTDNSVQNASYASGQGSATATQQPTYTTQRVVRTITTKGKKRIRFGNEGSSWINTYWNFGQPVYGETGRF